MTLRSEADLVRTLEGTVSLDDIYALAEASVPTDRADGHDVVHGATDTRWKRRVRGALQRAARDGRARRVGPGQWEFESTWVVDGTAEAPRRALLVLLGGELSHTELVLGDVERLMAETEDPFDLVVADPPWGLERQQERARGERVYQRNSDQVVGGYVDVDAAEYAEFTERWVTSAAGRLRRGAYLAAITGPQQAARIVVAGEAAGLTFVNQVAVRRPFALRTSRQFAHAHNVATVLCSGPLDNRRRFFACPADLPRAANGNEYPLDLWIDVPKYERPDQLRYDNALHPIVVRRLVQALTPGPENGGDPWQSLVADPFLGSGTTAVVCLEHRRRFIGGDVNPESLRFTMGRLLDEHVRPRDRQPAMFA